MSPSWHRPQLSVRQRRGAEKLLVILVTRRGQRRDSQAVTTVTLLHLKLTACHTADSWQFRVYYRGKISSKLCEVC